MAAFLLSYKAVYKDLNLPTQSVSRKNDKSLLFDPINMHRDRFPKTKIEKGIAPRCLGQARGGSLHHKKKQVTCLQRVCGPHSQIKFIKGCNSKRNQFSLVSCSSSESGNIEKQLRSLDSYFGKLQDNATPLSPSDSSDQVIEEYNEKGQSISTNGLESLNAYLGKLNNGAGQESYVSSTYIELHNEENMRKKTESDYSQKQQTYVNIRTKGQREGRLSRDTLQQDEVSNLYLIGTLASINIAVLLFEIASPIRNSDLELFSIPLLYGAKINHLIVVGEWWRLVTPMFLHSGIFHMALSGWGLVSFGPHVCRGYGSFTFLLIYILGGVSGNLTSFLHTPDPTVGGTGPVFAIIGAWLTYQMQNRDVDDKDTSETMFQKAIVFTAASFILSHFCPIDDWSHFGAAITGMAYGYFTSPRFELKDASSSSSSSSGRGSQEEGLKLVRHYGDSCRSAFVFAIFIVFLSSFLLFMEPPLNALASADEVVYDYLVFYASESSLK